MQDKKIYQNVSPVTATADGLSGETLKRLQFYLDALAGDVGSLDAYELFNGVTYKMSSYQKLSTIFENIDNGTLCDMMWWAEDYEESETLKEQESAREKKLIMFYWRGIEDIINQSKK